MFSDDAVLASRELNLTLTTRDRDKESEDRIPMCEYLITPRKTI